MNALRSPRPRLVSSRSLVAMAQAARAVGIEVNLTTLTPQYDPGDASGAVPLEHQIAVCRSILSDPRETLGLELARHLPLESTGLWGFLLRSSSTFGEMLSRARRYQRIVNVFEEFTLEEREEQIAIICRHPDPSPFGAREQVVIWLLGHWLAWGRQLSGHPMPVDSEGGPACPLANGRVFNSTERQLALTHACGPFSEVNLTTIKRRERLLKNLPPLPIPNNWRFPSAT